MMNSKSKVSNKHATYLLKEWNEEARGVTTSRSKHNEEAKRRKEVNRQKGFGSDGGGGSDGGV